MALMSSGVLDSGKTMDDDNKRRGLDVVENGQLDTPVVSPCSSFGNERESGLHSDGRNDDDIDDNKIADFGDSEFLKSLESAAYECQTVAVSDASCGSTEAAVVDCSDPGSVASASNGCASVLLPAAAADDHNNSDDDDDDDDDDARSTNLSDSEMDWSDSVAGKRESIDTSGAACQRVEAVPESCPDQADNDAESNGCSDAGPVEDVNAESRDDCDSLQMTVSSIAPDNDCTVTNRNNAQLKFPVSAELLPEKTVDAGDLKCTDAADDKLAELTRSECDSNEGNQTETVKNAVNDDVTGECLKESSVSPSQVTSLDDGVTTSLSTVVSAPLSSSQSSSAMSAKSDVSCGMPATSTTSASHLSQLLEKPQKVPLATMSTYSSNTRQMSRLLQDVGLLLVSQRVFKDLSSIQKQKLCSQETRSAADQDMLRKLKASHERLAAKNRSLLTAEQRCWCGYRSESVNVLESHRLLCNAQGRCCYCQGTFVYRTQNQMKKHLWKVHKKLGRIIERPLGHYCICAYCPMQLSTHAAFMRHMTVCRDSFWLATNLAPKEDEKDIPIFATAKKKLQRQPIRVPVALLTSQPSVAAVSQNVSGNVPVLSTPAVSSAVAPSVDLQLTPVPRNPGPGTQLVQIGKQLFALLASSASSSTPSVAATKALTMKCVGEMTTTTMAQGPRSVATLQHGTVPARVDKPSQPVSATAALKTSTPQYTVCPVCGAFVKDTPSLMVHMKVAHTSTHKLCQYCRSPSVSFPTSAELNIHIFRCHTAACWICRGQFQPPVRLIEHIADRHRVTMAKMLELCRCYLCSSVPGFLTFAKFEEHMVKMHAMHFSDTSKLWDCILNSPDANRMWDVKQNADGTLECPHCAGHFVSQTFLYRHLHLQHDGILIRLVQCRECNRRVPSTLMSDHLLTTHTQACSVPLVPVNMSGAECIFIPPAGTRLLVKRKRRPASKVGRLKRVRTVETVVISDDDVNDDENEDGDDDDDDDYECDEDDGKKDDSNDEDFMLPGVTVQPATRQLRCSDHTRAGRRNSSVDDVREVLESIVDSGTSQTVPDRSVSFHNAADRSLPRGSHPCNGITEDEVEIIESIVPAICDRRQQLVSKVGQIKSVGGTKALTNSVSHECDKSSNQVKVVNTSGTSDRSDLELVLNEHAGGESGQPSTKPKPALADSSAQQLMARDQIMMNEVEEVLEIDGETVLIVQSDNTDNDDCT